MKLKYIATIITASIVTVGGTALFSNNAIASTFANDSIVIAGNPCAANPCASVNPCAANPCAANPCASVNPCAANPCASVNPCAANPCASVDPCAANPCAANPCASANPCAAAKSAEFVAVGSRNQTQGTFEVVEEDGKQYIEFSDDFEVSEGPDLKIILHADPTVESSIAEGDYVTLAPIESFIGTQRYEVPEDVDLNDYASVAIWCEEFNVTFGYAEL